MKYALLECEPHMTDEIDALLPRGVIRTRDPWNFDPRGNALAQVPIVGGERKIPAVVVRLHTTLSKSGKRRCKLVPA